MEKYGKTAVFPGGYGRIGDIPHGQLRPDWGLKGGCSAITKIIQHQKMLSAGLTGNLHDVPNVCPINTPSDQYVRDGGQTGSK